MINKIRKYIAQRQNLVKQPIVETDILLGSKPKNIKSFLTFKEFHKNSHFSIKKIKEHLKQAKGKLIINGNLKQNYISKLMKLVLKEKGEFSVIVNDGYRLSKKRNIENSSQVAVILEPLNKGSE
ncbi:DUF1694 domain-containing protein [Candidatus Enterococcus murrayae]|uniref:DUF1694 domain-containing protein n=1 Tax=Candidatus Enterococcus murrayae TaxID=2815321 RepID=A0ABS3HEH6_9ENTE|nr:DUF1694 domain-containing protein [Enterococcus sp. MJM16]MBO0451861.1 DUF1694 domain-containing protein [Enterococcus sp. MJM16]